MAKSVPPGAENEPTPKRGVGRRLLRAFGTVVLVCFLGGLAFFAYLWFAIDVPKPNDFAVSQNTIIYFDDAKTPIGQYMSENRIPVTIDQIPDLTQKAVIAAEDRSFYRNVGISIPGIARAFINNLAGGGKQGASTITQQYVKNYYLTQERTYSRKIKEIILALKIDKEQTKDEILTNYLNTIYFGRGAYGVETAAQAYFGKHVSQLNMEQGATIAAIIQAPGYYDPALGDNNAENLAERFTYVTGGMAEEGWITEDEAAGAKVPKIIKPKTGNSHGGTKGYLTDVVRRELLKLGFSDTEITGGGLRVKTTYNRKVQDAIETSAQNEAPYDWQAQQVHFGIATVEPGTGRIKGFYGGPDFITRPMNDATQSAPQGGSTFKAFTLVAALREGIPLWATFWGNSPLEVPGSSPVNNEFDSDYGDAVSLRKATEESINTAFVDLTMQIGADKVVQAIVDAGLPKDTPGLYENARVTLGTASVTPLQMAEMYATLAAGGKHVEPYTVEQVTRPDGTVAYKAKPKVTQVIDSRVVADVTSALEDVVQNGTGRKAQALGRPAAGKTGTAALRPDTTTSAWFAGYTPQLATAVGYFRGDGTVDLDGVGGLSTFFGSEYPCRMWTSVMQGAMEGLPVEEFPEPANIGGEFTPTVKPRPSSTAVVPQPTVEPAPVDTPTATPTETATVEPTPTVEPTATATAEPTPTAAVTSEPTVAPEPAPTSAGAAPSASAGGAKSTPAAVAPPAVSPPAPKTPAPTSAPAPSRAARAAVVKPVPVPSPSPTP